MNIKRAFKTAGEWLAYAIATVAFVYVMFGE